MLSVTSETDFVFLYQKLFVATASSPMVVMGTLSRCQSCIETVDVIRLFVPLRRLRFTVGVEQTLKQNPNCPDDEGKFPFLTLFTGLHALE